MSRVRRMQFGTWLTMVLLAVALPGWVTVSTGAPAAAASVRRTRPAPPPGSLLPPQSSVFAFTGVAGLGVSARIGRAKVNVFLPPVTAAAYIQPYYIRDGVRNRGFARAPRNLQPLHPNSNCDYYYSGLYTDLYVVDIDQPDAAHPGSVPLNGRLRSVGVFPPTRVSLLAFGSIPVTAVLHIRQSTRNGRPQPLFIDPVSVRESVPTGQPLDPATLSNTGCDSAWERSSAKPNIVTGDVEATVSDVRIDGHAVDVGDSCRTSTPVHLDLTGETAAVGGHFETINNADGILYQRRIRGYSHDPDPVELYPDSANLTIPPFTGCRAASGDDVSRLLTAITSGSENTLAVKEGNPSVGYFDPDHPSLCDDPAQLFGAPQVCAVAPAPVSPPTAGR